MKQLFKPQTFKSIISILAVLLGIKILWTIVEVAWLPTSGIDYQVESKGRNLYYRVNFAPTQGVANIQKPVQVQGSIRDIKLVAVYSASQRAVVAIEHKGKTTVLATGDEINGFVLDGAGSDYATFLKDEEVYKVELQKQSGTKSGTGSIMPRGKATVSTDQKKPVGEITDTGGRKLVDRSLVTHYATNMDAIFKDIGISDIKQNGEVKGFKVSFIRAGSYFSQLGLQRGDVIKAINGQEINNYNAAFGIYKQIQNIDNLTLVIERDNKEMELEYEVN